MLRGQSSLPNSLNGGDRDGSLGGGIVWAATLALKRNKKNTRPTDIFIKPPKNVSLNAPKIEDKGADPNFIDCAILMPDHGIKLILMQVFDSTEIVYARQW